MARFSRSLWGPEAEAPISRLALAVVLSPLLMTALLAGLAFLVGGVSEPDRDAVIAYTLTVSTWLAIALAGFTLTFGLAGIATLWAFGLRGIVAWALTGAVLGCIGGVVVDYFRSGTPYWVVPAAFAIVGWVLFLTIRWIAGIRLPRGPQGSASA